MATKKTKKVTEKVDKVKKVVKKVIKAPAKVMEGHRVVRVYDAETHGEDYYKLAEQFVAQYPNYTIK